VRVCFSVLQALKSDVRANAVLACGACCLRASKSTACAVRYARCSNAREPCVQKAAKAVYVLAYKVAMRFKSVLQK
jgi:hypothetical protein